MTMVDIRQAVLESLARYEESHGDPTRAIYERFYRVHPEAIEELAFDTVLENRMMAGILALLADVADGSIDPGGAVYWVSDHVAWEVSETMIMGMFGAVRDTVREGLGPEWTARMDADWAGLLAALAPAMRDAVSEAGGIVSEG
ncbi:hypothetical protein [Gordonia hirsuta]|uniref:hypothetical protein n=1 Tax=Gordonia hirsuta TaxID=53427 RepID=UPI0004628DF2|nr:hypothetical protein [Gordonia hirsuta]